MEYINKMLYKCGITVSFYLFTHNKCSQYNVLLPYSKTLQLRT